MGRRAIGLFLAAMALAGCATADSNTQDQTFGGDVSFLQKHAEVVVLQDRSGSGQVAVVPAMQGRIMTSTAGGPGGKSFGWINRELIASGQTLKHMNPYGGEDRFWIGPEGGQFSIFFAKDVPFDFDHWQTPAAIDTEPFEVVSKTADAASFRRTMRLVNYSGTTFDVQVDREISVLDRDQAIEQLGAPVGPSVKMVAFESSNRMTNAGTEPWTRQTGLLSIWILGMFNPSPQTTIVVPFNVGPESRLGPVVNDTYFGKVPASRLVVRDGVLFFSGDGQYRSKIGLTPKRARNVLGSYDAANQVLTIVQYNKPQGVLDYVNSMWELQNEPFRGDTINSYNDGPATPGAKPMGPFYELETSSPAAALAPGQSIVHTHRTFHLVGGKAELDPIAKALLGVTIAEITSALP
ncbi:MAG: hypothetical protein RBS72_16780 [Sedimentisphaerales bacterium]|nr:hypothetical protein [Sedimentisphaerales bacterium]HNY79208.1 hypothetical protein [Sedimentisphaerales bacterium]HOC61496.1 hypothetical protein [Sedimentisphaerales bacterium]HOH65240.1 hypothetical protein [Sedimentisphaerales bacterium]HPY51825.1 hypothetical protein [Sedimentisphaerales bacterium]